MGKGALVFKGEKKAKKKGKPSKAALGSAGRTANRSGSGNIDTRNETDESHGEGEPSAGTAPIPQVKDGDGSITTSGTVVTGHFGTKFQQTLRSGDALLVEDQMRVITMILSEESAAISTSFTKDFASPTPYQYICKPRDLQAEKESKQQLEKRSKKEEESRANGLYGSESELVYRERTEHGSYRIRREKLSSASSFSREDLLDMRSKKKSDRYC